jgi:hypothetical protein
VWEGTGLDLYIFNFAVVGESDRLCAALSLTSGKEHGTPYMEGWLDYQQL